MEINNAPISCSADERDEIISKVAEYKHQISDFVYQNFDTLYPYFETGERLEDVCDMIYDLMVDKQVYNPWRSGVAIKRVMFSDQNKSKYCPYSECNSCSMGYDDIMHFRVCVSCGTLILPVTMDYFCPEYWQIKAMYAKWNLQNRKRDFEDYGIGYVVRDISYDTKFAITRKVNLFKSKVKSAMGKDNE